MPESESTRFQVGYALPARKLTHFMTPSFINHAKYHGIDFIKIDVSKPLTDQSHFDCILHKLNTNEWYINLDNYILKNTNAIIMDPPSNIKRLHDRISMLDSIPQLNVTKLKIPTQILVSDSSSLSSLLASSELKFPMIAKPLAADSTTKSHKMSLVSSQEGLLKLDLDSPVVLQQFVNHGGVIFKIYVADDYVKCVKRRSLPDISDEVLKKVAVESGGVLCFSQISNSAMAGENGEGSSEEVEMPEAEFVDEVAKGIRQALGLRLFNFDMIRDVTGSGYFVIDINYFPGYEKLDSYENVMTDFLLNVMKSATRGAENLGFTIGAP